MRLVQLVLRNIRSYGDEPITIEFGPGITLFWGDIGSGKSTILAAIEFGLFGLGDLSKSHLLRHDERRGDVEVTFAVSNREYTVHRALRRTKRGIDQTDCWLESQGRRSSYAPSELKPIVLSLLNFRERPDPRATSSIYRYAVYTPQEEMKAILLRRPEERLETLRRAFGIEEYRWAVQNTEEHLLRAWLDREIAIYAARSEGLGAVREARAEAETEIIGIRHLIALAEERLADCHARRRAVEEDINPLVGAPEEVARLEGELRGVTREIEYETAALEGARQREAELTETLARIPETEAVLAAVQPEYDNLQRLTMERRRLAPLREETQRLEVQRAALQQECEAARLEAERELTRVEASLVESAAIDERIHTLEAEDHEAASIESRFVELLAREATIDTDLAAWSGARGRLEGERTGLMTRARNLEAEEEELVGLDAVAICPRCRQSLTPQHIDRLRTDIGRTLAELRERMAAVDDADHEIQAEIAELQNERRELEVWRYELVEVRRRRAELAGRILELKGRALKRDEEVAEAACLRAVLANDAYRESTRETYHRVRNRLAELAPVRPAWEEADRHIAALEEARVVDRYVEAQRALDRLREAAQNLEPLHEEINSVVQRITNLRDIVAAFTEAQKIAGTALQRLRGLEKSLLEVREQEWDIQLALNGERVRLAHAEANCEVLDRELETLVAYARRQITLAETSRFVRDHFLRAVSEIERQALAHIRDQFDRLFRQWFDRLIELGELQAEIDSTFTPVVRLGEFELESESLSGGERTSLALAYRLALNTLVRQEVGMDRESLLILDEPTDGFSSQQLNRLRDILEETGCDQTIIVSHEQELEGVADRVYGVSKERGVSTVTPLAGAV
ncbi:MAG: SMC family ATPase [Methanospirillum sp.]